ncbi:hypothetical protein [Burkholderia gladioli]|uniref:hypothetical protein n=1 Tax=Burkholderia gladioli TaxID=28095 RepID=UPI0016404F38|nr:hypothetical protein [Burkholderia gladioli]
MGFVKREFVNLGGYGKMSRPRRKGAPTANTGGNVFSALRSLIRRRPSGGAQPSANTVLRFKDNEAAFSYACEYIDCTLHENAYVPALVTGSGTAANGQQIIELKIASQNGGFDWLAMPRDPLRNFFPGDLVIMVVGQTTPVLIGLIMDTIYPELDPVRGWKIKH